MPAFPIGILQIANNEKVTIFISRVRLRYEILDVRPVTQKALF